ncbi:class I SAM-dependent methyltransferase [Gordonia sp. HNM0687]|uniref:Class I SAM-dependent methyltransferase n=1 Tax=Gordonia mangrovi TaxID=2665643 RepID=A0A6L7GLV1_9ACTN|nr:class I SAM-dependent methyltransferase [Gordonia mangrovi]MXP20884.1 class I SAM-dependent methyltransferase [Gordonia mangrovi]UVF78564.1 class I SAM-dependent methyltransferase [Gordonia mangrovi]
MGYRFTRDDVAFLRSQSGSEALECASSLALSSATMLSDIAELRGRWPSHHAALIETLLCRRRGKTKINAAERMLFTDDALQQATASPVAAHRAVEIATRHPGAVVHDVTCSIGAELRELTAQQHISGVIGSDLDDVRLAMARHNTVLDSPPATLLVADALTPTSTADVIVADPGRRAGAGRVFRLDQLTPPLLDVLTTYATRPLAVKCAPGLDYQILWDRFGFTGQVQLTSLDGAVREACLWTDRDGEPRRRATVLRTDPSGSVRSYEITDADADDIGSGEVGEWILDPDGAVVRAGLVRHYARRHGLWQLDPQIAYLTGDRIPSGERGFRVLEGSGVSEKELRRRLAAYDCGTLEILVRGLDVNPDQLRKRLKLKGSRALAVILTRIGRRGVGFICEPGVRMP